MTRQTIQALRLGGLVRAGLCAAAFFAAVAAGHAQDGDAPDCENQDTQPVMTYCADLDYQVADEELNAIWPEMLAYAKARDEDVAPMAKDMGVPTTLEAMKTAQRAWIAYRDAQCEFEAYEVFGGTAQPMVGSLCLARLTGERIELFRSILDAAR